MTDLGLDGGPDHAQYHPMAKPMLHHNVPDCDWNAIGQYH